MRNHYQTLGIDKTATQDDIKRAYRRLASQHHPDKGGDTQRFQEIQQAYSVLGDEQSRQQYDNPPAGTQPLGSNFDFDSIFSMFGARFGQAMPEDMVSRMQLWISLRDVACGGRKQIAVSSSRGRSNIEIDIPTGIDDGSSVRYANLAPGGGDLVVLFRVRPEPGWERQGNTITHDVLVPVWDLILGAEIQVESLDGRSIAVTIPPRSQPGTMLRIPRYGLKTFRQQIQGDLLIRLQAQMPAVISPALLEAISRERNQ